MFPMLHSQAFLLCLGDSAERAHEMASSESLSMPMIECINGYGDFMIIDNSGKKVFTCIHLKSVFIVSSHLLEIDIIITHVYV